MSDVYLFFYSLFKRYPDRYSEAAKDYVRSLPYRIEMSDVCFTHFSPDAGVHGLYAPTDADSYITTLQKSRWPVLVNGHSHDPRIYRRLNGVIEDVRFDTDKSFKLEPGARYILTCGALEDLYCASFDIEARTFEVISLP